MSNKISVITVVYNDVTNIRKTMESYFSQTWEDKEYIVIDGGSTDGTVDIIREYANRLAYWCSEKDGGIYEAMNKGVGHATGDWINFLNSGDLYCNNNSLKDIISQTKEETDVVFGNSIVKNRYSDMPITAPADMAALNLYPIFRHGASLTRTSIQKKYPFDLSKKSELQYALDWDMLYRVYHDGHTFQKAEVFVQTYREEGASAHKYKSAIYNYKITSQYGFSLKKVTYLAKTIAWYVLTDLSVVKWGRAFIVEVVINDMLPLIYSWHIRKSLLKCTRMKIGKGSFVMKRNYFMSPSKISIGSHTHINGGCLLDGRGGLSIGNNVSISYRVSILTGSHDKDSEDFREIDKPVDIDDYAWIGANATILQNVHVGRGAVICAGAVVTKDVKPYHIAAGVPAKEIGHRSERLSYQCEWDTPFT